MPMKIVAVFEDQRLANNLSYVQSQAPASGYQVIPGFANLPALFTAIKNLLDANNFDCLETLEIHAHGRPSSLDGISNRDAATFAVQLRLTRLCDVVDLYLNGCNTAINVAGKNSVAQTVSALGPTVAQDNVMLTVYGSVGYIAGFHFDGQTTSSRETKMGGLFHSPYPDAPDARGGPGVNIGSQNAVGSSCWRGYREGRRVS
jgi:hypothetical protein